MFNSEGDLVDELKTCSPEEVLCTNTGIAIDDEGNVYVSDRVHHCVKKFTKDGRTITRWDLEGLGGFGTNPSPYALAVDNEGYVYVIDNGNDVFRNMPKFLTSPQQLPFVYQKVSMAKSLKN